MAEFYDKEWKAELATFAAEIKAMVLAANPDPGFAEIRPFYYSAFLIRKLIEDRGVTDKLKSKSITVASFPSTRNGKEVFLEGMLGDLLLEDFFDLDKSTVIRMSYTDIASEIIHNDGFIWHCDGDVAPDAFFVFSYRNTLKRAIHVRLESYLTVLDDVLADAPTRWWTSMDIETGKITRHAE